MARPKMRLGEFLVDRNLISKQDLIRALEHQKESGGRLGQILVTLNLITEDKLLAALKHHLEIPILELEEIFIDTEILKLVPKKLAEKYILLPVKITTSFGKRTLLVVMSNPMDIEAINEVEFAAGVFVQPVLAKERDLLRALNKYYDIDTGYTYLDFEKESDSENEDDMTIISGGKQFTVYEEQHHLHDSEENNHDTNASKASSSETSKSAFETREDRDTPVEFIPERGRPAISDLERQFASLTPASRAHLMKILITQLVRQKRTSLDDIEKWFHSKS